MRTTRTRSRKLKLGLGIASGVSLGLLVFTINLRAQTYGGGTSSSNAVPPSSPGSNVTARVAVSQDINQHIHSLVIRQEDIPGLLQIAQQQGSVNIESSAAYNNGDFTKPTHTHTVKIRTQDLLDLQNGKEVDIASETSEGHSHIFHFVTPLECQKIFVPPPTFVIVPTCPVGSACFCRQFPFAPSCNITFFVPPTFCPVGSQCFCSIFPNADNCSSHFSPTPSPSFSSPRPSPSASSPSPSPSASSPSPSPSASSPSPSPSLSSPVPSPSFSSPIPSPSFSSPIPSPSASSPSLAPSPSQSPATPCGCLLTPTDPSCANECQTRGEPCFCLTNPSDPSCSVASSCTPGDSACVGNAFGCS